LLWASNRIIAKAKEKNRGIFLNQMILKKIRKVKFRFEKGRIYERIFFIQSKSPSVYRGAKGEATLVIKL
jgi:hypothetical protein